MKLIYENKVDLKVDDDLRLKLWEAEWVFKFIAENLVKSLEKFSMFQIKLKV